MHDADTSPIRCPIKLVQKHHTCIMKHLGMLLPHDDAFLSNHAALPPKTLCVLSVCMLMALLHASSLFLGSPYY